MDKKTSAMKTKYDDKVWQSGVLARGFLQGVRGAIPLAREQLEIMLRLLERGKRIKRFLDLGCGDGVLGAAILSAHPQACGFFADFSQPMLDACRTKLASEASRVQLMRIDYARADWVEALRDHAPFDAVVSGFSIHHQPDARKRSIYRQVFDLLAPGGWFVHIEHVAPACATITNLFDEEMVEAIHRNQAGQSRATIRRKYVHRPDKAANILAPVETQCRWLRRIGFAEVDCYFKVYELAVFGGQKPA